MSRGARRRAELLSAVVAHLLEFGMAGFSLRVAASAAGTSHSMLLYHFGSQEALLREALHAIRERRLDDLRALARRKPRDMSAMLRLLGRETPELRVLRQSFGLAQIDPDRYGGIAVDAVHDDLAVTEELLARLVGDRQLPPGTATLVAAALRGLVFDGLVTGDRARVTLAVRVLESLVAAGGPDEAGSRSDAGGVAVI
ncbi:MAG TPA: TetR/AcrR family transcriptional regulator [Mycobacteriales bacterium]|nr:TetR/AcrR family transcriptional regulator [Mycobacteriales bacterium]